MNRVTKYQAWDSYQNKMYSWSEIGLMDKKGDLSLWNILIGEVDHIQIRQFSGLQDKDGTDVYEGDIIAHISTRSAGYQRSGDTIYHKIVFGKTNTDNNTLTDYIGFWATHLSDNDITCGGSIEYMLDSHGSLVVGNIYENPELLTG